jgi:hypothetical protein
MSQVDASGYHLRLEGAVLDFSPGEVVTFEGQQHLIYQVHIEGYPQQTTATQEFWLQPLTLPLAPGRKIPQWPAREIRAHVTANEHDPRQKGCVQVEFHFEHLDPQSSGERVWLPTLTPYGGGSGGKQSAQYSGIYSLHEIGEHVIVSFPHNWDSYAYIAGAIREHPQGTTYNPKQTKRWSTPSGNEILMHSHNGKDVFQVKTAGRMAFESQIEKGRHSLTISSGGNPSDMIHFEGTDGSCRLDISVATDLYMQAGNHIEIEGNSVTVRATGPGGVQLEAVTDGIGVRSITKGVTVQGQTGVSLKAPGEKVALEGATGVAVHAKGGKLELRGGPDVEINVNPIPEIPDMPATQ